MTRVSCICELTGRLAADSSEVALWNNLHISVLKATTLPVMNRLDLGILAFEAVNWMRYAPSKALYKARFRQFCTAKRITDVQATSRATTSMSSSAASRRLGR
jgi:hypothetical protein